MIEVQNVSKTFQVPEKTEGMRNKLVSLFNPSYKKVTAVERLSFHIAKGEIVGFIGPNGAGKSTTIKMLCGILLPTSGEIYIDGLVPSKNRRAVTRKIGAVFGQRTQLWWDLPVLDSLRLNQRIYNITEQTFDEKLKKFDDILQIGEFLHTPVRQLSLGQRMRADIIASMMHSPEILFLDEPTIGLDVIAKESVRELITTMNQELKVTIILTTHDMQDIEKTCRRIMVIDKGRLFHDGTLEMMKTKYYDRKTIAIDFDSTPVLPHVLPVGTELGEIKDCKVVLHYDPQQTNASLIITDIASKNSIKDVIVEDIKIEEIIKKMYINNSN